MCTAGPCAERPWQGQPARDGLRAGCDAPGLARHTYGRRGRRGGRGGRGGRSSHSGRGGRHWQGSHSGRGRARLAFVRELVREPGPASGAVCAWLPVCGAIGRGRAKCGWWHVVLHALVSHLSHSQPKLRPKAHPYPTLTLTLAPALAPALTPALTPAPAPHPLTPSPHPLPGAKSSSLTRTARTPRRSARAWSTPSNHDPADGTWAGWGGAGVCRWGQNVDGPSVLSCSSHAPSRSARDPRQAPPPQPNPNQERNVSVVEEHAFVITGASATCELQLNTDGPSTSRPHLPPPPPPPSCPGASCSCGCAALHRAGGTSSSSEGSSSGRRWEGSCGNRVLSCNLPS